MRRFVVLSLVACLATAAAVLPAPAPPSHAATQSTVVPVFPGLDRHHVAFTLDDGRVARANVLSLRADDPTLELRAVLARGTVPGLETVPTMGRRVLEDGGVAGVNGGFWLNNPVGDPNGFFVTEGKLVSEPETQGGGPRGTFARRADGGYVVDRLDASLAMVVQGQDQPFALTALNRYYRNSPPYPDDTVSPVYVYTPEFGATATARALTIDGATLPVRALVVEGLRPRPSGSASGQVTAVSSGEGSVPIPPDGSVVIAHGGAAARLAATPVGATVRVEVSLSPLNGSAGDWADVVEGLAAGPLLVRDGERVDPAGWENEGFAPATHSNVRHPRSAVALTNEGRILLVTVDGRQPGHSPGMTMHELSHFLRTMGAVHAVSLDGGGSTQMVTDGVLRNQACCDRQLRPVGTGLFVFHNYPFPASERLAGLGREATAARIAAAGHPNGADEVLIAPGANFPDALAGGPLATALDAPLLLTGAHEIPVATAQALDFLRPSRITILGGEGVISTEVEEALSTRARVRRLAGRDRIETAVAAAEAMGRSHRRIVLASAGRFPDALAAAGPAGMLGMPVLLTWQDALPTATLRVLRRFDVEEVVVVGGPGVVSDRVVDALTDLGLEVRRLAGGSRYATAQQVNAWAEEELPDLDHSEVVVANGEGFPDALAGGPFAARRNQLLLLVPGTQIEDNPTALAEVRTRQERFERAVLLGGNAVLSSYVQWQLDQAALEGDEGLLPTPRPGDVTVS